MPSKAEQLSVTLSREELSFLLFLLKSTSILGFDDDPLDKLSGENAALTYAHAERSLRARDLVMIDADGKVVVRESLMLMVGTCAYPEFLIAAHSFPSNGTPSRMFWNGRSGVLVSHERPDAPLHRLSFIKGRGSLYQEILSFVGLKFKDKPNYNEFKISNSELKKAREVAPESLLKAKNILLTSGVPETTADEVATTLNANYIVTTFHVLISQDVGGAKRDAYTFLVGKTSAWLSIASDEENFVLKPVGVSGLNKLFSEWTSPADAWINIHN